MNERSRRYRRLHIFLQNSSYTLFFRAVRGILFLKQELARKGGYP